MRKLFVNEPLSVGKSFSLNEEDSIHILRVLRMHAGDRVTVCSGGVDYLCEIRSDTEANAVLSVLDSGTSDAEPGVCVTLYVGMPKFDKLEMIIQKSVELGVTEIVPFVAKTSVSKPGDCTQKCVRWNKISLEAAKQCGRGAVPEVKIPPDFGTVCRSAGDYDLAVVCYEAGGEPLSKLLGRYPDARKIAFLSGPEGGITPKEFQMLTENGWKACTLGRRILRCETAPLCALSACMYQYGEF